MFFLLPYFHPRQMDDKLCGYVFEEEAVALYTFIRLDMSALEIKAAIDKECDSPIFGTDHDQMIVVSEFLAISEALLGKCSAARMPLRDPNPTPALDPTGLLWFTRGSCVCPYGGVVVDAGVENFMNDRAMIQTRHNHRWRIVASRLEELVHTVLCWLVVF